MGDLKSAEVFIRRPWFASSVAKTSEVVDQALKGVFMPGALYPDHPLGNPVDWTKEYQKDRNWAASLHAWKPLDALIYATESGDSSNATAAIGRAVILATNWQRWHRRHKCRWSWYDWSVGLRSARLAWLFQTFRSTFGTRYPRIATLLESMLTEHAHAVLSGVVPLKRTNHGLFQLHGLALLGRVSPDEALQQRIRQFIGAHTEELINAQFDRQGMHLEHSPSYHFLAVQLMDKLLAAAGSELPLGKGAARLVRAKRNARWLKDPSGRHWGIGDSSIALGSESIKRPQPRDSGARPSRPMRHFSCGYVSIRVKMDRSQESQGNDESALFVQGAFHSNIHKHLDDLTFELFELGSRLILDSGAYSYEQCPQRSYCVSTRAHNTVQLAGTDFSRNPDHAYGSAIHHCQEGAGIFTILASVVHPHLGLKHERRFVYKPGRYLVVADNLVYEQPDRPACQWFHLHPAAQLLTQNSLGARFSLGGHASFSMFEASGTNTEPRICKGQSSPELQGWYSPRHKELCPNYAVSMPLVGGRAATVICLDERSIEEARTHALTIRWSS